MSLVDLAGWAAAAFTLAAFTMKTMVPLRAMALVSNVFFIIHGYFAAVYPVLALHLLLLPFNAFRLLEIRQLLRQIRTAREGEFPLDWLAEFAQRRKAREGDRLFEKGDEADFFYYLVTGRVLLLPAERVLNGGEMFGEVAFFSSERERTQSAVCLADCEFLTIGEETFMKLYFQKPAFGFHVVTLLADRLGDDLKRAKKTAPPVRSAPVQRRKG